MISIIIPIFNEEKNLNKLIPYLQNCCKGYAATATYNIFYFVHADSIPPPSFCADILAAVNNGYALGRYQTRFEGNNWLLKFNAFFTRFDWFMCYGGDQTLFITKLLFSKLNGYQESLLMMEEYDLVERAKQLAKYKIFSKAAIVSTRKYLANSWFKVQRANYKTVRLYKKGLSQPELVAQYKKELIDIK